MERKLIYTNISDLRDTLKPSERLMGLDVGSKTIGLALSNSDINISVGIDTIRRKKFRDDCETLTKIINNRSVGGLKGRIQINYIHKRQGDGLVIGLRHIIYSAAHV